MAQHDTFTCSGKHDVVFSDDIPTSNGRESDISALARPSDAIARPVTNRLKLDTTPGGAMKPDISGSRPVDTRRDWTMAGKAGSPAGPGATIAALRGCRQAC